MFEGPFAAFVLTAAVGLFLTFLSWIVARHSGLAPLQNTLVDTLQDTVAALEKQVALTEAEKEKAIQTAEAHRIKVEQLSAAILDLASENAALRRKKGEPPRHPTAIEREVMS